MKCEKCENTMRLISYDPDGVDNACIWVCDCCNNVCCSSEEGHAQEIFFLKDKRYWEGKMLSEKRIVAIMPANPHHCPKCGTGLVEHDEPENHYISGGNDCTIGGEIHYTCPACNIEWAKHLIPDHYLYDPDCFWCPECGSEDKRETDIIDNLNGRTITYCCSRCNKVWRVVVP